MCLSGLFNYFMSVFFPPNSFILFRVMNLFMNVSVETCQGLLSIIDIRTASELHMGSSSRQEYASLKLLWIFLKALPCFFLTCVSLQKS